VNDGHRAEHLDRTDDDLHPGPAGAPEHALIGKASSEEVDGVRGSPPSEVPSVRRNIAPGALSRSWVERSTTLTA